MKYIDAEKLVAGLKHLQERFEFSTYEAIYHLIESLQQDQPECIEKIARISPGLLSNFGTSTYVLDVDLTQDEMAKVAPFGFNSGKIKIKIVCE